MGKINRETEYNNYMVISDIRAVHDINEGEQTDCKITYYVNDSIIYNGSGKFSIRRSNELYPHITIIKPIIDKYTSTFQENSCVYEYNKESATFTIKCIYTPYQMRDAVNVKVVISF